MRFLPVNLNALLVELDDLEQTLSLLDSLHAQPIAGIEELVPAARTILISYCPKTISAENIAANIRQKNLGSKSNQRETLIEVPVHYNGEDLAEVAQILGITPEEVIERHTGSEYTVAFTGFAPGFAYMSGGHPSFDIPRRKTPRTRLPAGAVGLAGIFSGIYPNESPGGWQILGITQACMWDLTRTPPALLQPGFRVRFVDVAKLPAGEEERLLKICMGQPAALNTGAPSHSQDDLAALEVEFPGLQTIFQDQGRFGKAGQGVSASGALDQAAMQAANRIVGNAPNTAVLENVFGHLSLKCRKEATLAIAGADVPITITTQDGQKIEAQTYAPIQLNDGDTLALDAPLAGLRAYIAVQGGFAINPVLDSYATDTLAHVGPEPLAQGDVLPIHPVSTRTTSAAEKPAYTLSKAGDTVTLDIVFGPRTDWFTPEAAKLLTTQVWQVTQESNRVGIRLAGEIPLERANKKELPSEGTATGAIQVPSSGQPVLFLADHPLTGGYPVIASVASHHLDLAGQIPVDAYIRFNPVTEFKEFSV